MRGHLRKRGEQSWQITFSLGRDPTTGKYERRSFTVHGAGLDAFPLSVATPYCPRLLHVVSATPGRVPCSASSRRKRRQQG